MKFFHQHTDHEQTTKRLEGLRYKEQRLLLYGCLQKPSLMAEGGSYWFSQILIFIKL